MKIFRQRKNIFGRVGGSKVWSQRGVTDRKSVV